MEHLFRIPSTSLLGKQYSKERMEAACKKAEAASMVFGGLIGNCYLMAEIVDGEIVECIGLMKKRKWYRHEIKKKTKDAWKFLKRSISTSTTGELTKPSILRCYADTLADYLHNDLVILRLSIKKELAKRNMPDVEVLSEMVLIEILLQYITQYYDMRKAYMETKMNIDYDIIYKLVRCTDAYDSWKEVVDMYTSIFMPEGHIVIAKIKEIDDAFGILYRKMNSAEVADVIRNAVKEEEGDDGNKGIFDKAAQELGII